MEKHQPHPVKARAATAGDQHPPQPARERGYRDGQQCRMRDEALTTYTRIGIDEYALGFRAGYFGRTHPHAPRQTQRHAPAHPVTE